jgi:hypothetical protein
MEHTHQPAPASPKPEPPEKGQLLLDQSVRSSYTCLDCQQTWEPRANARLREDGKPRRCPACRSVNWDVVPSQRARRRKQKRRVPGDQPEHWAQTGVVASEASEHRAVTASLTEDGKGEPSRSLQEITEGLAPSQSTEIVSQAPAQSLQSDEGSLQPEAIPRAANGNSDPDSSLSFIRFMEAITAQSSVQILGWLRVVAKFAVYCVLLAAVTLAASSAETRLGIAFQWTFPTSLTVAALLWFALSRVRRAAAIMLANLLVRFGVGPLVYCGVWGLLIAPQTGRPMAPSEANAGRDRLCLIYDDVSPRRQAKIVAAVHLIEESWPSSMAREAAVFLETVGA